MADVEIEGAALYSLLAVLGVRRSSPPPGPRSLVRNAPTPQKVTPYGGIFENAQSSYGLEHLRSKFGRRCVLTVLPERVDDR